MNKRINYLGISFIIAINVSAKNGLIVTCNDSSNLHYYQKIDTNKENIEKDLIKLERDMKNYINNLTGFDDELYSILMKNGLK